MVLVLELKYLLLAKNISLINSTFYIRQRRNFLRNQKIFYLLVIHLLRGGNGKSYRLDKNFLIIPTFRGGKGGVKEIAGYLDHLWRDSLLSLLYLCIYEVKDMNVFIFTSYTHIIQIIICIICFRLMVH